jgi:hypothetical protein
MPPLFASVTRALKRASLRDTTIFQVNGALIPLLNLFIADSICVCSRSFHFCTRVLDCASVSFPTSPSSTPFIGLCRIDLHRHILLAGLMFPLSCFAPRQCFFPVSQCSCCLFLTHLSLYLLEILFATMGVNAAALSTDSACPRL